MKNKIAGIERAVMSLKPFTSGLASGFGINKLFSKSVAKKLVGKTDIGTGLKYRDRKSVEKIVHGDDVFKAQKELEQGVKNVYEKDKLPNFVYGSSGPSGEVVKFPKRLRGGIVNVSKKDKALYYAGKYGPTSVAVKGSVAGAVGGGIYIGSDRAQRPAQVPDDMSAWKSLDKSASGAYINSKENNMIKNPNFQIAFSDQLHKIATSDSHPEAVGLLKEAANWGGMASKAWRSVKRFAKNPILKTKEKAYQAGKGIETIRSKYHPSQMQRLRSSGTAKNMETGAANMRARIVDKRNKKIQNIAERVGGDSGQLALNQKKWMQDSKHKYSPDVVNRQRGEQWVRNKNLRAQKNIQDKNIAKAKLEEKKLEIANIQAGIDKKKGQSIITRIGGGITSKDTPGSVKTIIGGGAVAAGGATAYNLTMAEKKKKDNSIFKFGGKAKKKKSSAFGMLSVKAGIDNNPKPTAADRIAGAKMKKESYAKPKKKVIKKKVTKKAIKY